MEEGFTLHDRDIREPLFEYFEATHDKVRILEEIVIGKSRADAVMVTERALTGIEIKSDADTYARLQRQVSDYDRYFDYNMVVVGSHHALHAAEHVPEWWGILSVEWTGSRLDIYQIRDGSLNPKSVTRKKLDLLWKRELFDILDANHLPKYRQKSRTFIADQLIKRMDEDSLGKAASDELFERDYTVFDDLE